MHKSIINNWSWESSPIQIVKRSPTMLIKTGSWYRIYKQDPDNTYVNALFLGSDEYWGSNRNGDAFEEQELINSHHTFIDHANHFKHHENDNPKNSYGKICETFYNPDMHRVEGIIKIINKKSLDMLDRIDRGLMVPLSMACRVKNDICLLAGTLINTSDEKVPIEDVKEGDLVLSRNGKFNKVHTLFKRNVNKYLEIKISGLETSLNITSNHPVLALSKKFTNNKLVKKWTPIGDLRINDYLCQPRSNKKHTQNMYDLEGELFFPIQNIIKHKISTQVYNLGVTDDESYVANNILVHNCSICGNKAKQTEDYCDDLKFNMNKILPDGRKVRAFNPNPIFFDISEVTRGADSTAFTLKKVAACYENLHNRQSYNGNSFCKSASYNSINKKLFLDYNNNRLYNTKNMFYKESAKKTLYNNEKKAILERLAAIEKKLDIGIYKADPGIKILSKGVCVKELPEQFKKDSNFVGAFSKTGITIFTNLPGRSYMYRNLLKESNLTNLLSYIPNKSEVFYKDELDNKTKEMSNLKKYALDRIKFGSYKRIFKNYNNAFSSELLKVACINLAAICNNPSLMQDKFFPELTVLQNFCN